MAGKYYRKFAGKTDDPPNIQSDSRVLQHKAHGATSAPYTIVCQPVASEVALTISDLRRRLSNHESINDIFKTSCKFLNQYMPISQASLALYNSQTDAFSVSAIRTGNRYGFGVEFKLDARQSLLSRAKDSTNSVVTEAPPSRDLRFLDSKILLGDGTSSLAILPLRRGDQFLGTFNLGTEVALNLQHYDDNLFAHFAQELSERLDVLLNPPEQQELDTEF
jgi:hypothetical protein